MASILNAARALDVALTAMQQLQREPGPIPPQELRDHGNQLRRQHEALLGIVALWNQDISPEVVAMEGVPDLHERLIEALQLATVEVEVALNTYRGLSDGECSVLMAAGVTLGNVLESVSARIFAPLVAA